MPRLRSKGVSKDDRLRQICKRLGEHGRRVYWDGAEDTLRTAIERARLKVSNAGALKLDCFEYYWGLGELEPHTYEEVAAIVGRNVTYVSEMINGAFKILRDPSLYNRVH